MLRLTESGCGDDELRCDVDYRIRMPMAMSAEITAQAGGSRWTASAGTCTSPPRPVPSKVGRSPARSDHRDRGRGGVTGVRRGADAGAGQNQRGCG